MYSIVQICNLALRRIGKTPIQDINNLKDTHAKYCKAFFDHCRDEVLSKVHWNFATKKIALAQLQNPPAGWAYRYQYPADCIEAREIATAVRGADPIPFEKIVSEDGNEVHILTDQAQAVLVYTARVVNPTIYSPGFVEALAYRLAAELCDPLVKSEKKTEKLLQKYQVAMSSAALTNNSEAALDKPREASWIEARS